MTQFDLSMKRLDRAMRLCQGGVRYYLKFALIEPVESGGALIVSTNGRALLLQYDPEAIAPHRTCVRAEPPAPLPHEPDEWEDEPGAPLRWHWCSARVRFDHAPGTVQAAPVCWHDDDAPGTHVILTQNDPETYPDWRKTFFSGPRKSYGAPRLDRTLEKPDGLSLDVLTALTGWTNHFRIAPTGFGCPSLVTFNDDPHAIGLFMPAKLESDIADKGYALLKRAGLEAPEDKVTL